MSIRMDNEVKAQAQALFAQFGLDMTTAINMFLRQAIRERGIPFGLYLEPDLSLETAVRDSLTRQNLYGPFDTAEEAVASMLEESYAED
jgi:DNA-damage-inducible protein J